MIADAIQKTLQDIIRGALVEGQGDHCKTVRNLLNQSFGTDPTLKSEFESRAILKEKQAEFLISHAHKFGLWLANPTSNCEYLTRGGEAEIYLASDKRHVVKINAAVYYATWMEYFNSLTIHNLLFPNTAYSLLGFAKCGTDGLCAVVSQPFVKGEQASLDDIRELLTFNAFVNIKRQDYYNEELGLMLEDMHDENVIALGNALFFIDTVFYIMKNK